MALTETDIERINQIPMNFVMGRERSGTTLLQVMLNTHPNVVAPPESRFIVLWYSRYGSVTKWTDKLLRKFTDDIYTEKLFSNFWNINKEKLLESILPVKEYLTYPLLCKIVYSFAAPDSKDVRLFVDKNPIYYLFLNEISAIYPDAKYIHIVRDYRDNILSHQRVFTIKSTAYVAYHWVRINEMIEKAKSKSPERWITIKYESLVTEPIDNLSTIYKFLGLPFDKSMVKPHQDNIHEGFQQNIANPRTILFHENLYKPLNASRIDEWKKKMTAKDLSIAEAIAGNMGEKMYGYKPHLVAGKATVGLYKLLKAKLTFTGSIYLFRTAAGWPWFYRFMRSFWKRFIMKKK
jgi:hypothetical protein